MTASLNEKLSRVEWGEYRIKDLFTSCAIKHKLKKETCQNFGQYPAYSSDSTNSGIIGYTENPEFLVDSKLCKFVVFGDHTRTMNIPSQSFSVLDNVKVLKVKLEKLQNSYKALLFVFSIWRKQIPNLGYSRHWKIAKDCVLTLPTKKGSIDFEFIESFVAELEAYLQATGLSNTDLTQDEEEAICIYEQLCKGNSGVKSKFGRLRFMTANLFKLFGKATRGKRLKGDDRIPGSLPFVTAGEDKTGISAFISNNVEVFRANTTTIDMFGSAKYRNYDYGADDHIAVVHTEDLPKMASVFITTAIHKSSHNGQFNYGKNFYAKDADALEIVLPFTEEGIPAYGFMSLLVSAIHKHVIKGVVDYADKKISAYRRVTELS